MTGPRLGFAFVSVLAVTALILGLVGVERGWFESENSRVGDMIRQALPSDPESTTTSLDLGAVVGGEWDRVVVSCSGMTSTDVGAVLGAAADNIDLPDVQMSTVILYFANGNQLERKYNGDNGGLSFAAPFDPCTQGDERLSHPLVMTRGHATLQLTRHAGSSVWELAS